MFNNKKVLGFIPARGGSKGVPNKNIRKIAGKELIGYTLEAAHQSEVFDKIIVSTDSNEIANVAKKFGGEVPFLRPSELAQDDSKVMDAIIHTMNWFEQKRETFDILVYLQPTSPMRTGKHIVSALNLMTKKDADSIISVNKTDTVVERLGVLPDSGEMKNFIDPKVEHANRQELRDYYELNGAIHIADWNKLLQQKSWYMQRAYAFVMEKPESLDIDDRFDIFFADFLIQNNYV